MHEDLINKIKKYFKDKPVIKAYLFGSQSRGEHRMDSDVDILVELDYSKPIGLKFIRMQLDLEKILNNEVDLVSEKGISKYIRPYIEKEKVLIYERTN
jgi:predicted nucleotidyltransferase